MNLVDFLSSCPIFPGNSFKNMTRIVLFFFVPIEFSRRYFFRIHFLSSHAESFECGYYIATKGVRTPLEQKVIPLFLVQDNLSSTGLQLDHIDVLYYPRHPSALFIWSITLPKNCLWAPYTSLPCRR